MSKELMRKGGFLPSNSSLTDKERRPTTRKDGLLRAGSDPELGRGVAGSRSKTASNIVYTVCRYFIRERIVADRAKLFKSGGSQAVRLPKDYRFEGQSEVLIYRNGRRVILEPVRRQWSEEFLDLAGSAEDFPYPADLPEAEPAPEFDP